jgi:putative DNA primase/helicase
MIPNAEQTPLGCVLESLEQPKKRKNGSYMALCPAHDDHNPSLSVLEGADGRIVLNCLAGCETEDVLSAIGLTWPDLFADNVHAIGKGKIVKVYDYTDANGNVLHQTVRFEPKRFLQRRPDGTGGYVWNLEGVETVLYRLPEVREAITSGRPVFIFEGEKDTDNARKRLGIVATTCPMGADKWRDSHTKTLAGAHTVFVADNDEAGRKHVRRAAAQVARVAESVKVLELPGLPNKGDLTDWIEAGGTREKLRELVRQTRPYEGNDEAQEEPPAIELCSTRASTVEPEDIRWLWDRRIAFGKLTMFDGDPDQGKSVVTTDITARVSTGRAFPDGARCEAANVAIVNVEDGVADTIVPRLMAHGADLDRVDIINGVPDGKGSTRLLEIPQDITMLEQFVVANEIKLLVIDPVLTMLGGDANKDQDARKALTPLRDMAERTGCAVIAVRHLNKSVGLKAIQRGGGNMGLIGVARAGAFFATDPEDDARRIMAQHKSNLAEKAPSLVYRIVTSEVHNTARIEWLGTSEYDANGLAADASTPQEKSELDEAKEFLRDELSSGPMWAKQVFKDARDANIAVKTLRRAKAGLRVKSEKIGIEGWSWSLPDEEPHNDHGHEDGREGGQKGSQDTSHDHLGHLGHLQINKGNRASQESSKVEHGQHGQTPEDGHLTNGSKRLTEEQAQKVQRLIGQGMSPKFARAEVLRGEGERHG